MRHDLLTYLEELKERGLSPQREARLRAELATVADGHGIHPIDCPAAHLPDQPKKVRPAGQHR